MPTVTTGLLEYWFAWLLCGLLLEVYGVWFRPAHYDTLSETTMLAFRVDTTFGYGALWGLMLFLAAWFPAHVRVLAKDGRMKADK
jgi:hypothetical protein